MKKFGTFSGVFVPSYEAILGAVLFLILPGLVGGIGLWSIFAVIILAHSVTLATGFSIADCATNLEHIGAGGMFAVARKSLGRAFGGSIGIQLFIAQAVSIGFYAIGFAEPLSNIVFSIPALALLAESAGWSLLVQRQLIATVIALIAFVASLIGAHFVVKIQMVIFVILTVAIASILISPFLGLSFADGPMFSPGINWDGNLPVIGFWLAFTAFFPAVTGIDAGVGMSGSLKNPKKSLPQGTFWSIAVTFVIYMGIALVFGMMRKGVLIDPGGQSRTVVEVFSGSPVIKLILLLGILFATGSSALSYFMTAPRTAQALVHKGVMPRMLRFIGRDFSPRGREPRWATLVTLCILLPVIWSGDITFVSTVVGICFLVVYGWINLAAFFERVSGNPSFRPTSKGHWSISLYGFLVCMVVIALFNLYVGIGVVVSQLIIFMLLLKYKSHSRMEGVWWGLTFSMINWAFKRMRHIIQGTKNWRPIVGTFVFADARESSLQTLAMNQRLSDYKGLTMINVLKPTKVDEPAFTLPPEAEAVRCEDDNFDQAVLAIIQGAVPGGLHVNTVFLPIDKRLHLVGLIEEIIGLGRSVLLYKSGFQTEQLNNGTSGTIDVWWKGEENGNFMALLSYIILQSDIGRGLPKRQIRIIRKLFAGENEASAREEMDTLLIGARLSGEVLILPEDDKGIHETIRKNSADASLIMVGMPGKKAAGLAKLFALDDIFFKKELERYEGFPPILFVKAALVMDLID